MNAHFQVAQVTLGQSSASVSPRTIKLTKPQGSQAITVHLDGATKLDLGDIANEKLTFVRVGDRLIILFDNQSTVTVEPFFDSAGFPFGNISVELGADNLMTGTEFAGAFPITDDQSVLPAAGESASGPLAGANFSDPSVDPISGRNPLDLLGNLDGAGGFGDQNSVSNSRPAIGSPTQGLVDDEGLDEGLIDGPGDLPGNATSFTGSLDIDFGIDFPVTLSFDAGQPTLAGIVSSGKPVAFIITTIAGQPAIIGYFDGSDPTVAANQVYTITLDVGGNGSYTFTLLQPFDHPVAGTEDSIELSINFTVMDASGDTASGAFGVTVNDDSPEVFTDETETKSVDEDGFEAGNPGTPEQGDYPGTDISADDNVTVTGNLGIHWGADKADTDDTGSQDGAVSGSTDDADLDGRAVYFTDGTVVAKTGLGEDASLVTLTSRGETVLYRLDESGTKLIGYVLIDQESESGGETIIIDEQPARLIFEVTLSDDGSGSYTFTLHDVLDHPQGGVEDDIALTFNFTARDFDGDPVDSQFSVVVDDDAPDQAAGKEVGKVDEDDLHNYHPVAHAFGWPIEGSNGTSPDGDTNSTGTTSTSGTLTDLVDFGADGPAASGGFAFAFDTNEEASAAIAALGLDSKGFDIDTAKLLGDWLVAGTGDRMVFALKLEDDGSYRFVLFDQLDHPEGDIEATDNPEAFQDRINIDFSAFITATDGDGDTITLDTDSFVVRIVDDVPKVAGCEHQTVNENDLANFNPLYPVLFNFWQGSLGTSPYDGNPADGTTGLFGTVPVWGTLADNIKGGADERGEFHLVSEDRAEDLLAKLGPDCGALYSKGDLIDDARYVHIDGIGDVMGFFACDGRLVFGLYVGDDGLYNFRLFDQIDHKDGDDLLASLDLDLSKFVTFTDHDGDVIDLGNGTFVVTVTDDAPVVVGCEHQSVNENDLANFNPLYPAVFDFWQGSIGTSPYDGNPADGITGLFGTVPVWGFLGDNVRGGADEFGKFHLVSETQAETLLATLGDGGYLKSHGDVVNDARMIHIDGIGDLMGFFASDGRLVFGLYMNETGVYNFRLFDQIDHPLGDDPETPAPEAVADTIDLDLSHFVTYTDRDGDTVDLADNGDGMFVIAVTDDIPKVIGCLSTTLDEDDLHTFIPLGDLLGSLPELLQLIPGLSNLILWQGSNGTSPDGDTDLLIGTTSKQGFLNSLVATGADEIGLPIIDGGLPIGTYGLVSEERAEQLLASLPWSSKGAQIDEVRTFSIDGVGTAMGFFADGRLVFSLSVAEIGAYDLRLFDQLDHEGANDDSLTLDLSKFITYTDFDGDTIDMGENNFVLTVIDDAPEVVCGAKVTATVEEEQLWLLGGDMLHGNEDGDDANGADNDAPGNLNIATSNVAFGSLAALINGGADEKGTFSFDAGIAGQAVKNAAGQVLYSHGVAMAYALVNGTLVGFADSDGDHVLDSGERTVFTLSLADVNPLDTANNDLFTFTLLDQIDHPDPNGASTEDIQAVDLSGAIRYTDADGDHVGLAEKSFQIDVVDDTPVQVAGKTIVGTVEEEELTGGNEDNTPNPIDNDPSIFSPTTEKATGDLRSLVSVGADETSTDSIFGIPYAWNGTFSLASDTGDLAIVKSDKQGVSYAVVAGADSDTLFAYVETNGIVGYQEADREVFTLEVEPDGDYTFTLLDQIDHEVVQGENVATLDFSSILRFSDYDLDTIGFTDGAFTVQVIDDTPLVTDDTPASVSEDSGTTNFASLLANDKPGTDGATLTHVSFNGTDFVEIVSGSDAVRAGVGTYVFNADGTWSFTPESGYAGDATFSYKITDGDGDVSAAATVGFNVAPVNDPPEINDVDNISVAENQVGALIDTFTVSDPDTASGLTFRVLDQNGDVDPRFIVVNASGTTMGQPGTYELRLAGGLFLDYEAENVDGDATITLTIEVDDNGIGSHLDTAPITITVTNGPDPLVVNEATSVEGRYAFTNNGGSQDPKLIDFASSSLFASGAAAIGYAFSLVYRTDSDDSWLVKEAATGDVSGNPRVNYGSIFNGTYDGDGDYGLYVYRVTATDGDGHSLSTYVAFSAVHNGGGLGAPLPGTTYNVDSDLAAAAVSGFSLLSGDVINITNAGVSETVFANGGHDVVIGTSDANTIDGGTGDDAIYGMGGNDTLIGGASVTFIGTTPGGNDFIDGGDGDDTIYGDGAIVNDTDNAGNDVLLGGAGNDTISGGGGADILDGGTGDDSLYGENGADTIIGGLGSDFLSGGSGSDDFLYYSPADRGTTFDTIDGFNAGTGNNGGKVDEILIDTVGFGLGTFANENTFDALVGIGSDVATFTTVGKNFYVDTSGNDAGLYYDADGFDTGASYIMLARLENLTGTFDATDINRLV